MLPSSPQEIFGFLETHKTKEPSSIEEALAKEGFEYEREYIIMRVPNIVDISYGRGVGYTFTQHDLGNEIHNISATQIRAQLRAEGKLK